jgi:hypothetical protein
MKKRSKMTMETEQKLINVAYQAHRKNLGWKGVIMALVAVGAIIPGNADAAKRKLNCGWPHPDAACSAVAPVKPIVADVTPTPAPAATTTPNLIQGVLEALIEVQAQFVSDVNAADTEATVLWPPSVNGVAPAGQGPIDPIAHACYPTLSSWAAGLALPATPTTTPATTPVAIFEDARVANIVAHDLVSQISSVGFPNPLVIACGGLVTDTVTQEGVDAGQIASFATMLATFIPKPILLKHNVGFLADWQKPRSAK